MNMPVSQAGQKALLHKGGQPLNPAQIPTGGGEADVEKARFRGAALPALFSMGAVHTHHNSVLTARLGPGRSTLS